eukprot:TRINITY_DN68359_c0_g1_i1.p1 TRINITY_DN68359_c0_g1~~TRINITY_DN68359_c0_g1_i1.p1  ORF type:complete len:380 (-),score=91.79 TRINITY_DN68359_c0_g1_i1:734-1873(-)
MQDSMTPGAETFESTSRVAQWLVDQQLPWLDGLDFEALARLLRLFCVNSHPCKQAGNTSGLLKWGTMINHSCIPNVVYSSVKAADGEFEGHFRACRSIKAGEVLGVSYMKLPAALSSLSQRRRMLWYLKGFVCQCPRCLFESAHGDPARCLPCQECESKECRLNWRFCPGLGAYGFSGSSCGRLLGLEEKEKSLALRSSEAELSGAAVGALCARWSSLQAAEAALKELTTQTSELLHEDHFARQTLKLLLLALEADDLLKQLDQKASGATVKGPLTREVALRWLRSTFEFGSWQKSVRGKGHAGLGHEGMLLMLAFKSVAPAAVSLSKLVTGGTAPGHEEPWLIELCGWAETLLAMDSSWSGAGDGAGDGAEAEGGDES